MPTDSAAQALRTTAIMVHDEAAKAETNPQLVMNGTYTLLTPVLLSPAIAELNWDYSLVIQWTNWVYGIQSMIPQGRWNEIMTVSNALAGMIPEA